jgi:hypothetical protein
MILNATWKPVSLCVPKRTVPVHPRPAHHDQPTYQCITSPPPPLLIINTDSRGHMTMQSLIAKKRGDGHRAKTMAYQGQDPTRKALRVVLYSIPLQSSMLHGAMMI